MSSADEFVPGVHREIGIDPGLAMSAAVAEYSLQIMGPSGRRVSSALRAVSRSAPVIEESDLV